MRKINFTVEIADNDITELNLHKFLHENLGKSIIDYQVLPNTRKMYEEDATFRKLANEVAKNKRIKNEYINENLRNYEE